MTPALHLHALSTVFMTGVIWLVQLVHYPSFHWLERERFAGAMKLHRTRTTFVVLPAMVLEAVTGVFLLVEASSPFLPLWLWGNLLAIGALWATTFLVSVPLHEKLARGYDSVLVEKLIATNWPRTILWTARTLVLFFVVRPL